MKAVVLCGGQGTRLREETEFRPKPLVPVGERPILWHIMKHLAAGGIRDFVLCLGYRGEMIKEYFLNYEAMNSDFSLCLGKRNSIEYHNDHSEQDIRVTLVDTGQKTNTGGRVRRVERYVDGERFLLTYGDGVADVDIPRLIEFHESHGRIATITTVRPVSRFGIVSCSGEREVLSFTEKPTVESWANAGFMIFEPAVFDYLGSDESVLEREPLERLCADRQLMAYHHDGFFFAMDTYRDYQVLNELWESGSAPWKVW